MSDFDKTNTGAIFPNEQRDNPNSPTHRGSINVNGKEFWVSGWIKPTKKDPSKRFMSLSIKPKEQQAPKPSPAKGGATGFDDFEDAPF